jgi:spore maturation protein A
VIGWICFILILFGTVFGLLNGTISEVALEILSVPSRCVTLILDMGGSLCLFCGLIRVAERAGPVTAFSRFLSRPVGFLIPRTRRDEVARNAVTMNLASNFFGLGNAATPYGIQGSDRLFQGKITRSLAVFLILNTCSVQVIPSTVLALRQANGAVDASDILPAVWIVQVLSCLFGVLLVRLVFREEK